MGVQRIKASFLAAASAVLLCAPSAHALGASIEALYARPFAFPAPLLPPPPIGSTGKILPPADGAVRAQKADVYPDGSFIRVRVVKVYDGDTITVMDGDKKLRIRLAEIDSPEMSQPYGTEARDFSAGLVLDTMAAVEVRNTDMYGRIVGMVHLSDGRILNRELVRSGWAWWYEYFSDDESLGELQKQARAAGIGLWADPDPEPPWEYRRRQRRTSSLEDGPTRDPYDGLPPLHRKPAH